MARHFKATARRLAREEESRRWHTFHGAALPLQKKFPSFKEFVKPSAPQTTRRRQSGDEQLAAFRALMDRRRRKS